MKKLTLPHKRSKPLNITHEDSCIIERFFEMPNIHTFQMPKLRKWMLQWMQGEVLNVFAGETKLKEYPGKIIYNDINPNFKCDCHFDVSEIAEHFAAESFDTILFDPPYTHFQGVHYYEGKLCRDINRAKAQCDILLKHGGIAISFGYNSTGFGKKNGFKKKAILLVNCGAGHNDIIVTVERKIQRKLLEASSE